MKHAYHFNPETLLYSGTSEVFKVTGYDKYILPQFATWLALPKYDDETQQCYFESDNNTWLIKQKPISVMAYNKQTQQTKQFDDESLLTDDFTIQKPATQFDEWEIDGWVTNQSKKYIHDYEQVDILRRSQYSQMCDPLVSEANIKRLQGNEDEAVELEAQALAAWQKTHDENPWPGNPTG